MVQKIFVKIFGDDFLAFLITIFVKFFCEFCKIMKFVETKFCNFSLYLSLYKEARHLLIDYTISTEFLYLNILTDINYQDAVFYEVGNVVQNLAH